MGYVPGWLFSRAIAGTLSPDPLERHYERVISSVLLNGWIAFMLAEIGVFSLWLHVMLLLAVSSILLAIAIPRSRHTCPLKATSHRLHWGEWAGYLIIGVIALVLVLPPFQTVLGVRDAGVYANTGFAIARTGGIVQHDALLADLGQAAQSADPDIRGPAQQALSNFLGVQHPERFIATRMRAAGFFINEGEASQGRVVPQGFHLLPTWIALLTSVFGFGGGLAAPGLMAVLGAWSVGMVGRRLAGRWVGLLAMLFLVLNSVQVWFARYSTSETTAQFLTFAGLYGFVVFQQLEWARSRQDSQKTTDFPSQSPSFAPPLQSPVFYATVAGVAFGQLMLTRIDFFLVVGPLLLYILFSWVSHRWSLAHTALTVALGILMVHAGLHIIFIARAYFFDTAFARLQDYAITSYAAQPFITPLLREVYHTTNRSPFKDPWQLWREIAAITAGVGILIALWRFPKPINAISRWVYCSRRWLARAGAVGIVVLAGYGYLIRPHILTPDLLMALPSCLTPEQISHPEAECLTLQGYIGAPIEIPSPPPGLDEKYVIPLANLVRVGWYLSPIGIVLSVVGIAWWWWRGLNRASWLLLVVGLVGTFFFVRQTYGTSDQTYIYILRRFVPVSYPFLSLGIGYALVALARLPSHYWPHWPAWGAWTWRGSMWGVGAILVAFFVWTGQPIYRHVEYAGALEQFRSLAERFEADDVVLLRGGAPTATQFRDIPDLIMTPLHFAFGVDALTIKSSDPSHYADALDQQLQYWNEEERDIYLLLSASGGDMVFPSFGLDPLGYVTYVTIDLPEFEQLTDQKPHNVARLRLPMALYRLVPHSEAQSAHYQGRVPLPIGPYDMAAQVEGFYLAEDEPTLYAWTNGHAIVRLPWPQAGERSPETLVIEAAGGDRPAHLGNATLCPTLSWQEENARQEVALECITLGEEMARHQVAVQPYEGQTGGEVLLHLESGTWVPAREDPHQHDKRAVGVQFGGVDVK